MFISDYLSRFSANNTETDCIPFLTSQKDLTGNLYINHDISDACYTIADWPDDRQAHCFPLTHLQARAQNISLSGSFQLEGSSQNKSKTP